MKDRYLAIADYPKQQRRLCDIRQAETLDTFAKAVWLESKTLEQFARNASLSEGHAKRLDKRFSSLSEHRLEKRRSYEPLTPEKLAALDKIDWVRYSPF